MNTSVMSGLRDSAHLLKQIDLNFLNSLEEDEKNEYFIVEEPNSIVDSARVDVSSISKYKIKFSLPYYPYTSIQIDNTDKNLIMENTKYIKYIIQTSSSKTFDFLLQKEYQEIKENGFKGSIEDYFSKRDYT